MSVTTSPTRSRTRQAIVDAAIAAIAQNPAVSLGEIATAAGVGRTTLHRYFAERSDLLTAVVAEGNHRLRRATTLARLDEGTGRDALLRLCREYFDLGDLLSLVFGEAQLTLGDDECFDQVTEVDFAALVDRGHADGSIDSRLPASWIGSLLWSQLYAAWHHQGEESRHEVLGLLLHSLGGGLRPQP
jgi:AcrR family transcriptional regulator